MTETQFYAAIGRVTREQGWDLDSVSTLALSFIAQNKTRRAQFVRRLKEVQREENAEHLANEVLGN